MELIEWKNEQGEREKFHLNSKKLICHKWGDPIEWEQLGDLLEITLPILKCMELQYHGHASVSITAANALECRTLTTTCNAYV